MTSCPPKWRYQVSGIASHPPISLIDLCNPYSPLKGYLPSVSLSSAASLGPHYNCPGKDLVMEDEVDDNFFNDADEEGPS